jgi:hypothetical protein
MNPIAVTAVQAMVAPVVLITTAAILSGGLLTIYGSVNDRMRAMDHERLELLTGAEGELLSPAQVRPSGRERLTQIDTQLPKLLRRHRLLHNAIRAGVRRAIDHHLDRRDRLRSAAHPIARVLIEAPAVRLVRRTEAKSSQLRNVMAEEYIPAHIADYGRLVCALAAVVLTHRFSRYVRLAGT